MSMKDTMRGSESLLVIGMYLIGVVSGLVAGLALANIL